jgi:SAM-dependent methyltransferase
MKNMNQNKQTKQADYGQDMPGIIIVSTILALFLLAIAGWQFYKYAGSQSNHNLIIAIALSSFGILLIILAITGIWSSRFGKLKLRDKVLEKLNFNGSESILDLGCGRGLLLVEAAKRIPKGKAIGADIWDQNLEYKNYPQMVLDNAEIEGVSNRIEVVTADAQSLPFSDSSFDIVMTSLMMHHVQDINKALQEMARVVKPGGTIVIADVNSKRFIPIFKKMGLLDIESHYATRLFLVPTYVIKGMKIK